MKGPLRLALLAILAYGAFLFLQLPAHLLVERWGLPAGLSLQETRGSIWNGAATGLSYQGHDMGGLHWRLRPWRLLLGEVAVEAAWNSPYGEMTGVFGSGLFGAAVEADDVRLSLGMGLVSDLGWLSLPLAGTLTGQLDELSLRPGEPLSVSGRLRWRQAMLGDTEKLSLGDVEARLEEAGIRLGNRPGDLRLDGILKLLPGGRFELSSTLYPANARGETAIRLLSGVGSPTGDGGVRLQYSGSLSAKVPTGAQ